MLSFDLLEQAWNEHADRLLIIARTTSLQAADDAVQEAFLELASLDELPAQPLAWLVRVARNRLLQWQRSDRRRTERHVRVTRSRPAYFQELAEEQLDVDEATAALEGLPQQSREIVVMKLWGELTFEQISAELSHANAISSSTVHRHYHEAIEKLKAHFSETPIHSTQ